MIRSRNHSFAMVRVFLSFALLVVSSAGPLRFLAINAANSKVNWSLVESFARRSWSIRERKLERFGSLMRNQSFQVALEDSLEIVEDELKEVDGLILSSKGVGIATYLTWKGLWKGPLVLLSPIPNACEHILGGSWEVEWKSTMELLSRSGPVAIATGTSQDEELFVLESMEETGICGKLQRGSTTHTFEKCPWILRSFQGDHDWKSDPENAQHIARLIDSFFHSLGLNSEL